MWIPWNRRTKEGLEIAVGTTTRTRESKGGITTKACGPGFSVRLIFSLRDPFGNQTASSLLLLRPAVVRNSLYVLFIVARTCTNVCGSTQHENKCHRVEFQLAQLSNGELKTHTTHLEITLSGDCDAGGSATKHEVTPVPQPSNFSVPKPQLVN